MEDSVFKGKVQEWLNFAKWSASGGNSQPWEVIFREESNSIHIQLLIDPLYRKERWSPMDVEGRASVMALGALAFNITVAAAQDDYSLKNTFFLKSKNFWNSSAELVYEKNSHVESQYTVEDLYLRRTNREMYQKESLSPQLNEGLRKIVDSKKDHLIMVDATLHRQTATQKLVHLERLRWKESFYLNSLLAEISFDEKEEFGIPVDQLGVSIMDQIFLKFNKKIPALRNIFQMGGQYMSAFQNLVKPIKNSGGIFFLQAKDGSFENCFWLGYIYQELWTYLNKNGWAFQPISVPFIAQGMSKKARLRKEHQRALREAQSFFNDLLALNLYMPLIGFRTGKSNKQVGKSQRREIKVINEEKIAEKPLSIAR